MTGHRSRSGYGLSPRTKLHETDLELSTRWWGDYKGSFTQRAKPTDTFNSYIGEVFSRPKKAVRSASATSLTYTREANLSTTDVGLRKTPSVSSLSPSHRLSFDERTAERVIPTYRSYKPESGSWYTKTYAPTTWRSTQPDYVAKTEELRWKPKANPYSPYTQYYSRQAYAPSKVTPPSLSSYVRGSENYMKDFVSKRLQAWDKALPHFHNSYEASKPSTDRFNRHVYSSSVFCPAPTGLPSRYKGASHQYKMYKLSDRYLNLN